MIRIIKIIEESMSAKVYGLLKRPDEAVVVARAHSNPKFVEDCVRTMAQKVVEAFADLPDEASVSIEADQRGEHSPAQCLCREDGYHGRAAGRAGLPRGVKMSGIGKTPGIDRISGSLKGLLQEKEIIARCELLLRIYDSVRAASLSDPEIEELERLAGKPIAAGIFASIMNGEPIFFDLPRLDTYTQIDGRVFHFVHTKKYSRQDFDDARRKFEKSLPELKSILRQSLNDLLRQFMQDAGYRCVAGAREN